MGCFAMPKRVGPPSDDIAGWSSVTAHGTRSASARPACRRRRPGGGARRARSQPATTPARSASRAGSGWTTLGRAARRGCPSARHRALGARAARRLHGPRRTRQEVQDGAGHARPQRRARGALRRRGDRLPPGLPARPRARGGARRRRRAARRARASGSRPRAGRAVRGRGDGPRARARHARRRARDRARACRCVRPVLDFAHMHATSDGAFIDGRAVRRGARGRRRGDGARRARSTSTSPTSRSRTATRRSTCPTARARCGRSRSREALARFDRPATVISESPDEASSQAIGAAIQAATAARQ